MEQGLGKSCIEHKQEESINTVLTARKSGNASNSHHKDSINKTTNYVSIPDSSRCLVRTHDVLGVSCTQGTSSCGEDLLIAQSEARTLSLAYCAAHAKLHIADLPLDAPGVALCRGDSAVKIAWVLV